MGPWWRRMMLVVMPFIHLGGAAHACAAEQTTFAHRLPSPRHRNDQLFFSGPIRAGCPQCTRKDAGPGLGSAKNLLYTCYIPAMYLLCTYYKPTMYLLYTHYIPTMYQRYTYNIPTIYLLCTYCRPTTYILFACYVPMGCLCEIPFPYASYMPAICLLHTDKIIFLYACYTDPFSALCLLYAD